MRPIKFRIFSKGTSINPNFNKFGQMFDINQLIVQKYYPGTSIFDKEDFVIQQFTGLKDVNGVDIYEGDIILETWEENQPYGYCPDEYYNKTSKFVVEYNAPSFNFPKRYSDQISIEDYKLEIIGNIFEGENG